jgi:hypothetical protein
MIDGRFKMICFEDLRTDGPAKLTFEGKSESARDVQFNPLQQYDFAAAFENGTIQVISFETTAYYRASSAVIIS